MSQVLDINIKNKLLFAFLINLKTRTFLNNKKSTSGAVIDHHYKIILLFKNNSKRKKGKRVIY